ncbi:DEAD/DEAH box helicase [Frondihabitans australicus]|uniref:Helicase-like protein n=1 Tax=Frondihabitans australicus TaxID=386892 RepID=A0A495IM22_9MICO|nr:DEAD/DEAH box helicase [Frondihabitans australicus]RKR76216.1 helicase-like protein [Frondihabitans australicus]
MSPFNKSNSSRPGRPATGQAARGQAAGRKPGSKSPKHRGYRPEADQPKKNRWETAERNASRAQEQADRPGGRRYDRDDRTSGRPNWEPRTPGGSNSRFGGGRDDRDARNGARGGNDRGSRYDRDDRPARGGYDRDDRGSRFGGGRRDERPARGGDDRFRDERPARGADRGDRGGYDRRDDRDRAPRTEGRAPFVRRDDYGSGRPARHDRPARDDRGSRGGFDRDDRRPARDERPGRFDRDDRRSRFSRDERPARGGFDRDERPSRGGFGSDERRPSRGGFTGDDRRGSGREQRGGQSRSDFYPARDEASSWAPEADVKLEKLQAEMVTAAEVEGTTWGDLGLGDNITRQLQAMGAETPFPIQAATIPDVLAGRDVLGRGRTGSGKTIAFGAPLVEKLMENGGGKKRAMGRAPRALILAPTRELALQIDRTVQPIARSVGLFTTQIYGGVPQGRQVGALSRGVDIVIGTPGRIEDLVEQGRLDLSEVVVTVLDEADHMCDLGFLEPVQRIIRETAQLTPAGDRAQKLLFSATLDRGVAKLVDEFLVKPAVHEVAGEDQASATIDHRVLLIEQRDKVRVIEELASGEGKTLVFARTRAFAEQLAEELGDAGIPTTSLHGDLNQGRRTRNLQQLTSGRVNVLVATDVAARGIHVDDISLVIQADMPEEYKTYLHRAGRTGRAGKEGTVVTLITRQRQRKMGELLGRAEISAPMEQVRPGDRLIAEIAGA